MNIEERPGFDRRMKKEEINLLPVYRYLGPVHLIRTTEELDEVMEDLTCEDLLGFDTETRPAFLKGESYPPALMQLATSKAVFVFQLHSLKFRQKLRSILAKRQIIKAGVAPEFDVRQLLTLGKFTPAAFVDLSAMAEEAGIKNFGLRGLAAVLLGVRIAKGAKKSNWAQPVLTEAQLCYAATDAWISREIYLRLENCLNNGHEKTDDKRVQPCCC